MTLAIKACFIIVENCANLFLASLNVHVFYKEKEALTLSVFPDHLSLSPSILEFNNCIYDKFISMIIKNEITYPAVMEV